MRRVLRSQSGHPISVSLSAHPYRRKDRIWILPQTPIFPIHAPCRLDSGGSCGPRLAIRLGIFLSLVLFLCLAGRPLLSLCMPFALALLATWLTEPLLRFFHRRWNIPRGIGAIVLILLLVGALGGLMAALIWKGWSELSTLWGNWDQGWNAFQETYYQLSHALDKWLAYLPQQVQDTLWNLSGPAAGLAGGICL